MSLFRYPSILMTSGYKKSPGNWDKLNDLNGKISQISCLFLSEEEKSSKNSMYLTDYEC